MESSPLGELIAQPGAPLFLFLSRFPRSSPHFSRAKALRERIARIPKLRLRSRLSGARGKGGFPRASRAPHPAGNESIRGARSPCCGERGLRAGAGQGLLDPGRVCPARLPPPNAPGRPFPGPGTSLRFRLQRFPAARQGLTVTGDLQGSVVGAALLQLDIAVRGGFAGASLHVEVRRLLLRRVFVKGGRRAGRAGSLHAAIQGLTFLLAVAAPALSAAVTKALSFAGQESRAELVTCLKCPKRRGAFCVLGGCVVVGIHGSRITIRNTSISIHA